MGAVLGLLVVLLVGCAEGHTEPDASGCSSSTQCPAAWTCIDGRCRRLGDGSTAECVGHSTCDDGLSCNGLERCMDGICVPQSSVGLFHEVWSSKRSSRRSAGSVRPIPESSARS